MEDPASTVRARDAQATRARILAAAQTLFARGGYRSTTVRSIADLAEVSPNLITRYFGGKDGLFLAASRPEVATGDVLEGPLSGFGHRLARSILARWDDQTAEDPLLALLRAAGERPEAAEQLARFLDEDSVARVERYLRGAGLTPADARAGAVAVDALVLGVTTRMRVLPPGEGGREELARWLGGALQRIVGG